MISNNVLEEFFVWEEKNLIGLNQNSLKNVEQDNSVTTIEIKTDLTPSDSNDTMKPKSGIYKIVNKIDGKYYVGSTKDFDNRWNNHKSALISNRHPNDRLQRAWNKYGEQSFEFVITESTDSSKGILLEAEQKYLNIAKSEQNKCYNLNFDARGGQLSEYSIEKIRQKALDRDYTNHLARFTEEERKKIWGKSSSDNANWRGGTCNNHCKCGKPITFYSTTCMKCRPSTTFLGKKHTLESRQKMSIANSGRIVSEKTKALNKLKSTGLSNPNADLSTYRWKNLITDETFTGTRYEFRKVHNISVDSDKGIVKGKYKQTKSGWRLDTHETV